MNQRRKQQHRKYSNHNHQPQRTQSCHTTHSPSHRRQQRRHITTTNAPSQPHQGCINVTKTPPGKQHSPTRLFGQGVDIAYIPRFIETYAKFGQRFLRKSLHPTEIDIFNSFPKQNDGSDDVVKQSQFLASRWAFKEAMIKASGKRLLFPEMYLDRDRTKGGAAVDPRVQVMVEGNAADFFQLANLATHVAISHDKDYAISTVTLHQYEPFIGLDDKLLVDFKPGAMRQGDV